jgi:predicted GNAT family acetyltransferase
MGNDLEGARMKVNLDDVAVVDNAAAQRYEARVHDTLALIDYQRRGDHIILTHAEVPPRFEGQGIASKLARVALDDARAQGLAVIPRCPFVAAYIRRHPAYRDLVPSGERERYLGS